MASSAAMRFVATLAVVLLVTKSPAVYAEARLHDSRLAGRRLLEDSSAGPAPPRGTPPSPSGSAPSSNGIIVDYSKPHKAHSTAKAASATGIIVEDIKNGDAKSKAASATGIIVEESKSAEANSEADSAASIIIDGMLVKDTKSKSQTAKPEADADAAIIIDGAIVEESKSGTARSRSYVEKTKLTADAKAARSKAESEAAKFKAEAEAEIAAAGTGGP